MIYAYVTHTCSDVALATKLENYKKRKLFVNPYIHMLPEKEIDDICGTSYKTRKPQKQYS